MAPSRVAASQWAKRIFARQNCRVSRIRPSSCERSTFVPRKSGRHELQLDSVQPISQACRNAFHSETPSATSGYQTETVSCPIHDDLNLPFSDLSSPLLLPGMEAAVRTPPAWKSPYLVDFKTPRSALASVGVQPVPKSLCESPPSCGSPTKTPGRVAKIFGKLLPSTPREARERTSKKTKCQRRLNGLRVVYRLSTAMGLKTQTGSFKSLADLRRHLLQRHRSLHKAFKEMEKHLKECKDKEGTTWRKRNVEGGTHISMDLPEFTRAIAHFGVDSQQAQHFFELMDASGDGRITFDEFKCALVCMPRDILLQDFRKRLLAKYSSTHEAFKELSTAPGRRNKYVEEDQSRPLTREAFAFHLSRLGVEEQEASLLFDIIDTDVSGTISIEELCETLREVTPEISLEEFWHRFNARWPGIRVAAGMPEGRRHAAEMIFQILPSHCRGLLNDLPLGLSAEAWDLLCAQLDVSRPNAAELFKQCGTSKLWQGQRTSYAEYLEEPQAECDLDDFFDELQLWSQTPKVRQGPGMRQSYGRDMAQRLGSMKAQAMAV